MSIKEWWNGRSINEQIAVGGGGLLFVVVLVVAAIWAFQPRYEVLFSGLSRQDASSVTGHLSKAAIAYRLDAKDGSIQVRQADLQAARMKVAEEGLPVNQPMGFELFDNADFGLTDFAQRINFQRALEGELTRTIVSLEEVSRARLHLVLPEQGLFKRSDETPKASLTLILKEGETLTPARVRGIQDLIASSVPGMKSENVTIHDHKGVSLAGGAPGGTSSGTDRLDAKRAIEAYLTDKAEQALRHAFPSDRVAVAVDVDLDMDVRHVNRDENGTSLKPAGLQFSLGTSLTKTLPDGTEEVVPASSGARALNGSEVSRSVSEHVTESIDVAPGSIRKLTVGILFPVGWSAESRPGLIELVSNAIGADATRGDRVSIMELPDRGAPARSEDSLENALPWNGGEHDSSLRLDRNFAIFAALGLLVLSVVFAAIGFGFGRRSNGKAMSMRDRQRALAELREWLEPQDRPAGN